MSKVSNRDAIKSLSCIFVDCQSAHQVGMKIFNSIIEDKGEFKKHCDEFRKVCEDITTQIEIIKNLIPND